MLPFILLAIALVLLFLEFLFPSGAMAISAAVLLVLSFFSFGANTSPIVLLLFVIGALLCIVLVIRVALRWIRQTGKENTLMLDKTQEGYFASHLDLSLIGETGITLSDFKPTGKVQLKKGIVQASSDQGFLSKGTEVKIVGGEGTHYIVRKISDGT